MQMILNPLNDSIHNVITQALRQLQYHDQQKMLFWENADPDAPRKHEREVNLGRRSDL